MYVSENLEPFGAENAVRNKEPRIVLCDFHILVIYYVLHTHTSAATCIYGSKRMDLQLCILTILNIMSIH